jgi:hypothetical protein
MHAPLLDGKSVTQHLHITCQTDSNHEATTVRRKRINPAVTVLLLA